MDAKPIVCSDRLDCKLRDACIGIFYFDLSILISSNYSDDEPSLKLWQLLSSSDDELIKNTLLAKNTYNYFVKFELTFIQIFS